MIVDEYWPKWIGISDTRKEVSTMMLAGFKSRSGMREPRVFAISRFDDDLMIGLEAAVPDLQIRLRTLSLTKRVSTGWPTGLDAIEREHASE